MTFFGELALVLLLTTAISFIMKWLKQPLIVGYILTGIIAGPYYLNIIHSHDVIEVFSRLGITILLFIVGIHLSPRIIREVGTVAVSAGVGQVIFTAVIGFFLTALLGFSLVPSVIISIALTFSSTIIILKLLTDKNETQTLYGKIAVGILLVQDVIASIILIVVSATGEASSTSILTTVVLTLLKGIAALFVLALTSRHLLPRLTQFTGRNQELLFLFSITWGLAVATLFSFLGLSIEIGALIAGTVLSTSVYAEEISAKLRPLRDFFIILFFILLGSNMILSIGQTLLLPIFALSLFVLVGNPTIVFFLMNLLGYHKKTGFKTGLTVAQISEFSLILATLAEHLHHITQEHLTLIGFIGLITIPGSTYLILHSDKIYALIAPLLSKLEIRKTKNHAESKAEEYQAYLFGYNQVGEFFSKIFKKQDISYAVVDFDPQTTKSLEQKNVAQFYGDAANLEFLLELPIKKTKLIISSIPNIETNILLIKFFTQKSPRIAIVVFAGKKDSVDELYKAGATYVVYPYGLASDHIGNLLAKIGMNKTAIKQWAKR